MVIGILYCVQKTVCFVKQLFCIWFNFTYFLLSLPLSHINTFSPSETNHISANVTLSSSYYLSEEYVEQFNKSMTHTYKSRDFVIELTGVTDGCKYYQRKKVFTCLIIKLFIWATYCIGHDNILFQIEDWRMKMYELSVAGISHFGD